MPNTPKGTRDFLPDVVRKRNYIFGTIRSVFEKYGYQPIETPAMENLETLTGKYGDEGDRLIFRIIESGESAKAIYDTIAKDPTKRKDIFNVFKGGVSEFAERSNNLIVRSVKENTSMQEVSNQLFEEMMAQVEKPSKFDKTKYFLISLSLRIFFDSKSVLKVNMEDQRLNTAISFYDSLKESWDLEKTDQFKNDLIFWITYFLNDYDGVQLITGVFNELESENLSEKLSKKALRYDLTVPFARFVVQHQNELSFPFRRYQIQPVWRADRPQKGRYREFYQCDADVVGTDSLRCEVEYCQIFDEVFARLGLPVEIRLNNRKLLAALAEYIGEKDRLVPMTIAIDKLDKMPLDAVLEDLRKQEFPEPAIEKLKDFLEIAAEKLPNTEMLDRVGSLLGESQEGQKGIEELQFILEKIDQLGMESAKIVLDLSLARGLNYYTGAIFEVRPLTESQVGSICGGGRYDDLTGIFGKNDMSGVGISFGADRIYDLLEAENAFPDKETEGTKLLFVNFGESEADYCHNALVKIRKAGIRAELYPDSAKMKKQMKYANDKQIPYVALVGENEMKSGHLTLKDMDSGEQFALDIDELIQKLT